MSDIRLIKLVNGEELVVAVKEETVEDLLVVDPLPIDYQLQKEGLRFGFIPVPWMPLGVNVKIRKTNILASANPNDMLLNAYQERTGSVMTPPEKKIIL